MNEGRNVQARVLKKVRVLNTSKPDIAVLELNTGKQSEFFGIARSELTKIGEHLIKNAQSPKAADGDAPEGAA